MTKIMREFDGRCVVETDRESRTVHVTVFDTYGRWFKVRVAELVSSSEDADAGTQKDD